MNVGCKAFFPETVKCISQRLIFFALKRKKIQLNNGLLSYQELSFEQLVKISNAALIYPVKSGFKSHFPAVPFKFFYHIQFVLLKANRFFQYNRKTARYAIC